MIKSVDIKNDIAKIRKKFLVCSPLMITMGDEMRQRILLILAEAGADGMDVTDITARTRLSRPAVSHHLKILKDSGMIASHKNRTQVYYFICMGRAVSHLRDLLNAIDKLVSGVDTESVCEAAPWKLNASEQ